MMGSRNKHSVYWAYQETQGFLRNYLRRFYHCQQDIEDAMQEGFLKSFEIEKKQKINSPSAYLFMTVRNFACRDLKKKSLQNMTRIEDIELSNLTIHWKSIEDSLESRQNLSIFCDAADTLPEKCRKAFLLKKIYGFSQKEIAEMMGVSVSTVEKHLAKGLVRSMLYMAEHGDTDCYQRKKSPVEGRTKEQ